MGTAGGFKAVHDAEAPVRCGSWEEADEALCREEGNEKAVWKAAVNRKVNNCVYNWAGDRKTGRFATANKVKSVTSHEVINNI